MFDLRSPRSETTGLWFRSFQKTSDTKIFPHRSRGCRDTLGMQIQDKTELQGETQTKRGAFGENTEVLACCTVRGNKEQVPALDGPRTRRANAAVVSTFARS